MRSVAVNWQMPLSHSLHSHIFATPSIDIVTKLSSLGWMQSVAEDAGVSFLFQMFGRWAICLLFIFFFLLLLSYE